MKNTDKKVVVVRHRNERAYVSNKSKYTVHLVRRVGLGIERRVMSTAI